MYCILSICNLRLLDIFVITKSICSRFAQTRYDINLVAVRQHIECVSTYRVIYDISKISQEIYIDEKKTFFFVEKCLFFWQREKDSNPHKQSQSLSCYPYTISLSADIIIHHLRDLSIGKFNFFKKFFGVRKVPRREVLGAKSTKSWYTI